MYLPVDKRHTLYYPPYMKAFAWSDEKDQRLRKERGISFQDVLYCLEKGKVLDIVEHPNEQRYKGQKIFVIELNGYAFLVPFVEDENTIFLKTVIPSRKATKHYLGEEGS